MKSKLILIEVMPGSGKSTTGQLINSELTKINIPNRFYHELEDNHPLRIYEKLFTSLTIQEEADWFSMKVQELFTDFVNKTMDRKEVVIIESYIFQNTLDFAFNMGMNEHQVLDLTKNLQSILSHLDPVLIYYYQNHVEQHWRWMCNIRGPEFTQDRCGLYTDDDFIEAGSLWTRNQDFIFNVVQEWDIPKLIIKNEDYNWKEYKERINDFLM
ncbi:P-loop NTPase family protein [Paenibacillus dauci]|uniref:hypothetical protein n=1 Tax=Paenibacillus dauci TaxID=1567106 RepID=UPI000619316A|nr:hypothetical protein [Paenibacillus dauci]